MRFPQIALRLPDWVEDTLSEEDGIYPAVEDRVRLAIELSRSNIRHGTGGPFGAAIFERDTGQLLACGVNLVTSLGCSIFHAEMVAIMVAQSMIGDFDLGGPGRPPVRARRQHGAVCHVPRRGPLVGRQAPLVRRPRRGRLGAPGVRRKRWRDLPRRGGS